MHLLLHALFTDTNSHKTANSNLREIELILESHFQAINY